jgi:murein DD-endopeptidase MepM/ murein hydrolase activator NlpD
VIQRVIDWLSESSRRRKVVIIAIGLLLIAAIYVRYRLTRHGDDPRNEAFTRWWVGDEEERKALITVQHEPCPGAPFILPSEGYIGLLYGDPRGPYSDSHRHQGIDIFSDGDPGQMPVYAAYDGYVSRDPGWVSAVILRVPDDPLNPGRQIWLYYTHMAPASGEGDFIEAAFDPDASEVFVEQGTLLGYTGNYSGSARPVGVHLHFSIVLDNGSGSYRNELEFNNTVDPSRYLGMPVNYGCAPVVPTCSPNPLCPEAILSEAGG